MDDVVKMVVAIVVAAALIAVVWAGYSSMSATDDFDREQREQFTP